MSDQVHGTFVKVFFEQGEAGRVQYVVQSVHNLISVVLYFIEIVILAYYLLQRCLVGAVSGSSKSSN